MTTKLNSPGMTSYEAPPSVSNIRGSNTGIGWIIGIAEWGEVGKVIEVISMPDFEKKCGGYLAGYYLAKAAYTFFKNGGYKLYVVRTCHYTTGTADAIKASFTAQGFDEGVEDQSKVNTVKFEASGEGVRGNKINLSTKKAETTLAALIGTGAQTSATLTDASDFEVGDIVDISDASHHVRVVITAIATNVIYFSSITFVTGIASASPVKTASKHIVRTTLAEDLVTDATSVELVSVTGISIGSIISIVDTQTGSPYSVNVKVTDISQNVISFADVGTITTIALANSEVVSQEFNLTVYFSQDQVEKTYEYLSLCSEFETNYIENVVDSEYITTEDLDSAEGDIGDFPEVLDLEYLVSGADGLAGLTDADFSGSETYKNGLYAFDILPDMFAQISCPDRRSASFQQSLIVYAEARNLWAELDIDFGKTPEEAKEYVMNTAMLNTNHGEICYPNVKWKNPNNSVISVIPQSGATMGLNARIWSAIGKGPWIAAAGVEDGLYLGLEGFESDYTEDKTYRDLLYEARINALYRYPQYGNLKYGIRTLEVSGQFPQVPERVVFLYCRHSVINGTPWAVFKNIDISNLKRLKKTVRKFLLGVWRGGGLKGVTESEAFEIDVSFESVNTTARQEAGEMWCKIGLATKKAGEFVYFEFSKKIA